MAIKLNRALALDLVRCIKAIESARSDAFTVAMELGLRPGDTGIVLRSDGIDWTIQLQGDSVAWRKAINFDAIELPIIVGESIPVSNAQTGTEAACATPTEKPKRGRPSKAHPVAPIEPVPTPIAEAVQQVVDEVKPAALDTIFDPKPADATPPTAPAAPVEAPKVEKAGKAKPLSVDDFRLFVRKCSAVLGITDTQAILAKHCPDIKAGETAAPSRVPAAAYPACTLELTTLVDAKSKAGAAA